MGWKDWIFKKHDGKKEERRHARKSTRNLIRIRKDDKEEYGSLLNITDLSQSGVGFEIALKMEVEEVYHAELNAGERNISARILIRRSRYVGGGMKHYEVGAEFLEISDDDKAFLKDYTNNHNP